MFDSDKKNSIAKPMLAFAFSVAWPYDSGANMTSPAYCVHSKRFVSLRNEGTYIHVSNAGVEHNCDPSKAILLC